MITSMVASAPMRNPSLPAVQTRTGSTLSELCVAAGIDAKAPFSASRSLQALVGSKNFSLLNISDGFDKLVLPYPTNLDSAVEFIDNGLDMEVNSAILTLNPPAGATIDIGGEHKKITAVAMTLRWPSTKELSVLTAVTVEDDVTVTKKRNIVATALPINLKKTLATMGVEATTMEKLAAPNAIAFLTADPGRLLKLMYDRVPMALLMAGLINLKPDLELSTVEAWYDPTGLPVIKQAQVVCLTPADTWTSLVNLGGIQIVVEQVGFVLENALLSSQRISMHGSAVFKTQSSNEKDVRLLLSCQLDMSGKVEVAFSVSGTDSLDTLSSMLLPPASPSSITSAQVPFRNSPLSTLSKTSQLAITFTQSTGHTADYTLSKVSASTSFSGWKSFLPAEFPISNLVSVTDVAVALDILDPLEPLQRAVGASVALELKIGAQQATQKVVRLGFAANPLGSFGDYEYRLAASASDSGLSIADIAAGLGLSGVTESLTAAGSLIGQLLTEVHIRQFSVAVEKTNDTWSFANWSLDIWINNFVIIENTFSLSDVSVALENINGNLSCDLAGSLQIALINLECKFRLPSESLPGMFHKLEAPVPSRGLAYSNTAQA